MPEYAEILPAGTKLRMLGDRILLRPLDVHWSEHIIVARQGRPVRGEVVAIGPGRHPRRYNKDRSKYTLRSCYQHTDVKPGDIVELGGLNAFNGEGYIFPEVWIGTERFLICQEADVAGVQV